MQAVPVAIDTDHLLELVRDNVGADLPHYTDSLRNAFDACDPVFTRESYAEFFWHCASTVPGWLPQVMLSNAVAESTGSAKLLSLWEKVDYNEQVERQILHHGRDESRHSRLFLDLVDLAFPETVEPQLMDDMRTNLPDIRNVPYEKADQHVAEEVLVDALVQMNIGEIRTRIHLEMFAPLIYALTPDEDRDTVERILRGLARDEIRHIAYTASLMEEWADNGFRTLVRGLYERRLCDFNLITVSQTEGSVLAYGQGRFPDLLEV